ncbi:DUF262 domain-containing protein [Stratiformator vulcanicus]|uniref:GmrSD restriction endonucleases N-terminal domain-containing protein n=1 Tax=Stratiformator vulcanicus TaxID=2527980 RepID=A0A517QWH8_9PLAN|nr:DUF262 domain-containing protein [Stratiformator vulcanicus]QDT36022.1 hypothetical protein Pan189_03770 [Stratiformator vulcanicus]
MSYKPRTLFRLIEEINSSLFLPHIQRPFVWDEEQICRLFDSLMRNYPIQTLLFWRTKDPIKARKFMQTVEWDADLHDYYDNAKSEDGVQKVFVLDGQQRLQSLFALFNGSLKDTENSNNLDAYVDITSGNDVQDGDLLYKLLFSASVPGLPFYRIRNLLGKDAQKNASTLGDDLNDELDNFLQEGQKSRRDRQRQVRFNCGQLVSLLREEKHFWVEELDGVANDFPYKRILDIFVRVNSGGTKLDASDLMFAAMKEGWTEVEQNVEDVADMLNGNGLSFDKTFCLKCLVVAHGKGAELSPEKFTSAAGEALLRSIQGEWDRAEHAFQELRDFIKHYLNLYGDKVVRSYGSFVPLFDFLYHNPKPDESNRVLMRGYYYKSQLFNWYGAQTDNVVNALHTRLGKPLGGKFPLNDVKDYFSRSRGSGVMLTFEDLLNMRLRFIVLNMIYVQRFGISPFDVSFKGNTPHIDHIYPQSSLKSKLNLSTSEINHIGNYRFVGATDNIRKRAELPGSYFKRLLDGGVDIGPHLLVKDYVSDPTKMTFDLATYSDFRDRRLKEIFKIADRIVNPEVA